MQKITSTETPIIDGMDHKTMYQYVYDNLADHLDKYSVQELVTEVEDYYPELLEG